MVSNGHRFINAKAVGKVVRRKKRKRTTTKTMKRRDLMTDIVCRQYLALGLSLIPRL